jgi:hypothetical protein
VELPPKGGSYGRSHHGRSDELGGVQGSRHSNEWTSSF